MITLLLATAAAGSHAGSACGRPPPTAPPHDVVVPERVSQGCAVFGRAPPGSDVRLGDRPLRIDADGRFVFGVGRDQPGNLQLTVQPPDSAAQMFDVQVLPRDWKIERVDGVPRATVQPAPEIAARIAREQAQVVAARQQDSSRSDFAGGFIWPVEGRISGVFGSQRIYNGVPGAPHSGLDVAAGTGTPLRAPAAGEIRFVAPDLYLTGGTVLLDHGHGLTSVFLHLSRIDVEPGDIVEQGQVIGAVGATGRATGPHLHWGVNWFDVRLDPAGLPGIAGDQ